MALKYEINQVKINLENFRFFVRGIPKIGKTTFFRDFIMEYYGDPKYGLLISLGQENGYKALANITGIQCKTWSDFTDVVDDLVENKSDNEFKFICLDTVDRGFEIAEDKVLDIHRAQKNESAFSIDAALGGFAKGKNKAKVLLEKQVAKLENAGYGMMWLGHTKIKTLGDQVTDVVFEKVTGSLEFKYDALFSDRADFTVMIATESLAKDEKLTEQKRYIYFRSTPTIDAGSRIDPKYLPEKIECSAKGFIDTVTKALEQTANVSGKDADKLRKEQAKEAEKSAREFSENQKREKTGDGISLKEYLEKIVDLAQLLSPEEKKAKKLELESGKLPASPTEFKKIENMEIAQKVYKILIS